MHREAAISNTFDAKKKKKNVKNLEKQMVTMSEQTESLREMQCPEETKWKFYH